MDNTPFPPAGVEIDEGKNFTDTDSAFGDNDGQSATLSLASSVMRYRYENGRRYHAFRAGSYFFPNDELEQERLDIFHHMIDLVLDGDKFPSAEVLGNDLSPIQPTMLPPNVRFEVDDIEDDWAYKTRFDFIHTRYLATSINNWPRLVWQCYRHLNPGGWVEFCDFDFSNRSDDGTVTPELAMTENQRLIVESSRRLGRDPCPGPNLKSWVEGAGFINVTEVVYPMPIGCWAKNKKLKEIGAWNQAQYLQGVEAWSMNLLTHVLGWHPMEVQVHVAQVRNDARNKHIHSYYNMYIVYGQKPQDGPWGAVG
ncbi:hypothetical protein FQN50_005896 [Emmonsiellopsis sp. PD_5]|nr:hypothetical protein FQN50_005896 [Emmonsiellopsis sp. PD_5]